MDLLTIFLTLLVGLGLGAVVGVLWARSRPSAVNQVAAGMVDQAEVMQGLDRLSDQMHHLDRARATWQGEFDAQVTQLQRETRTLSTALRKPQVRGQWGELHLRRAVELAGLVDRCDFAEQVPARRRGPSPRPGRQPGRRTQGGGRCQGPARRLSRRDVHRRRRPPRGPPAPARRPAARPRRPARVQAVLALARREPGVRRAVPPGRVVPRGRARCRRRPDRVRRGPPGRPGDADHADRAAAHGRPRVGPRGARRPGPRDPPARPRAARPAGRSQRPPRPARPVAQRGRRPLQPERRLVRVAGAGLGPAVRRPVGHERRAAGAASDRRQQPVPITPGPARGRTARRRW